MRRLLVEDMLGRLARWLRILGYDAPLLSRPPLRVGPDEILLTRRRRLGGRERVFFVRYDRLKDQLQQVVAGLGLEIDPRRFFSRCLDCNLPVEPISREQASGLAPDFTLNTAEGFTRCPGCGRIFWPGSHGRRAARQLKEMLGEAYG